MQIEYSLVFKRHFRKLPPKEQELSKTIIERLANGEKLELKHKDHALKGEFLGFRECHIKPNLLLIYKKQNNRLVLYCLDIGSHSDLF